MIELLRSNDRVKISILCSLLKQASIEHDLFDANMSVLEGSIGALPARVMVDEERMEEARKILAALEKDAGSPD